MFGVYVQRLPHLLYPVPIHPALACVTHTRHTSHVAPHCPIKVWDLRRLERDVSFQSRLTYAAQPGRITAVSAVEDDSSVASASAAGSIHVWRVEYTTRPRPRGGTGGGGGTGGAAPDRYTGVVAKRQLSPGLGAVLDVQQWGSGLMLYGTQRGGVHGWDLRSRGDVWSLRSPSSQGLVEQLVSEPCLPSSSHGHWLLTGSTRGFLTLWDVRFQLPVRTWQHPMRCAIDGLAVACAPPGRLGLSLLPSSPAPVGPAGGPLVYVAAGRNEVGLWDVAAAHCRQVSPCICCSRGRYHLPQSSLLRHQGSLLPRRCSAWHAKYLCVCLT